MRLIAHRLGKTYRQADGPVVRGIDLEVPDGAFLALMGRSGSGKSTLLGMLAGTVRPTAGTVSYDGADLWALSDSRRSRLRAARTATVFQDYNLLEELSAAENIRLGAKLARRPLTRDEADAALERVGLAGLGPKRPDELSGGQRQRVAIARALLRDTPVVVLDEATTGLDPAARALVLDAVDGESDRALEHLHDRRHGRGLLLVDQLVGVEDELDDLQHLVVDDLADPHLAVGHRAGGRQAGVDTGLARGTRGLGHGADLLVRCGSCSTGRSRPAHRT